MARKAKEAAAETSGRKYTATEVKRGINDALRLKKEASESAGLAGKSVASFLETTGIDRTAFGMVLRLARMDPSRQQATLREFLGVAAAYGLFDQIDAFDDTTKLLAEIVGRASGSASSGSSEPSSAKRAKTAKGTGSKALDSVLN